jgi:hypothetical protein
MRRCTVAAEPVDGDDLRRRRRQSAHETVEREHDGGARILEHRADAVARVRRVHGHVRAPRLQDAEQADDHLERTLDENPDHDVGAHAVRDQLLRDAVRAFVELAVRERAASKDDCDGVRRPVYLCLERLVDAARPADTHARVVIPSKDRLRVLFGQPREIADPRVV